jgi:hypothetical protein
MTENRRFVQLYTGDAAVRVMALLAAAGLVLAAVNHERPLPLLFLLGWALYLLEEHLIHRFVFHAPAPRQQWLFDLLYRLHYGHHDQDRHRHLLFTPLWFALPITTGTIAALSLVMRPIDASIAVLAGSVPAYLLFEWLHLTSHVRMNKGRLGRYVTRRHARHHYIDHHHWYTVSPGGGIVDVALGSSPSAYAVVPNVRTCGLDPNDPRLVRSRARFGLDASLANGPAVSPRVAPGRAA